MVVIVVVVPVAVAPSSSGSVAKCYALPVLQMMLCFYTMGLMGRWAWHCEVCRVAVAVPVGMATDRV